MASSNPQAGPSQSNNLPPSAMCSVCLHIATDPVQLAKCRHLFCRSCIQEWLTTSRTCPVCRKTAARTGVRKADPVLLNIISELGANPPQLDDTTVWRIESNVYARDFDLFSLSDTLLTLSADQVGDLIDRDDLHASSEGIVLDAILRWIRSDEEHRNGDLLRLLKLVRLKHVDTDRLADLHGRYEERPADQPEVARLIQRVMNNRFMPNRYPIEDIQPRTGIAKKQEAELSQSLATVDSPQVEIQETHQQREVVVVLGGVCDYDSLNSVEYFDPVRQAWNPLPQMTTQRSHFAVVTLNNKLYAIGGDDGSEEVYDPLVGSWQLVASMARPRICHSATVHGGKIYVAGGFYSLPLESYDPCTDQWTTLASMSMSRSYCSLTSVGSHLWAIGGLGKEASTSLERYDPTANEWQLFRNVAGLARCRHAAVAFDGLNGQSGIILIGGGDHGYSDSILDTVQRMIVTGNEGSDSFVLEACLPLKSKRTNVSATISSDKIYVIGGCASSDSMELDTMETITLGNMASGWSLHAAKMAQKRVYHRSSTLRLPL